MSNWCATNFLLRGPEEDIKRFCDTVNSCFTKPDVKPNGFGKLWLGNLCVAFGYEYDECNGGLRGLLDPNPDSAACFFGPDPDNHRLEPEKNEDGTIQVRFSTQTAWGPSDWFMTMLDEKFPACEYGWKATDEFGNFHYIHNRRLLDEPYISVYVQDEYTLEVEPEEIYKVIPYINDVLEKPVIKDDVFDEAGNVRETFWELLCKHNEKEGNPYIEFIVNKEC